MEPVRITYDELLPYLVAANVAIGFLFGTFPLIAGLMMKNRKYAMFGFIGSIVGGGLLGVFLSYPVAAIFVWLILRKSPVQAGNEDKSRATESPADAETV